MGRRVYFNQLSKADIIFTTSDAHESSAIRQATGSIISHTMLVTEANKVIEAIAPVVTEHSWDDALEHAQATIALVYRRKGLTSGGDQDKVVAGARTFNGRPYDYLGAAGSGMSENKGLVGLGCSIHILTPACLAVGGAIALNAKDSNADKKLFCSELVARAFNIGGFSIVDGKATFANPNTVLISPHLDYVGHLVGG